MSNSNPRQYRTSLIGPTLFRLSYRGPLLCCQEEGQRPTGAGGETEGGGGETAEGETGSGEGRGEEETDVQLPEDHKQRAAGNGKLLCV